MLSGIRRSLQGVEPIVSKHEKSVPLSVDRALVLGLRQAALPRPTETFGAESLSGDMFEGAKLKAFLVIGAARQLIRAEFDLTLEDIDEPTRSKPSGYALVKGKSRLYGEAALEIAMKQAANNTSNGARYDSTLVTSTLSVEPSRAALLAVTPDLIAATLATNHPVFAEEYCRRVVSMHQADLATQRSVS